ncbi:hypothetical protein AC579_838 [Pseudocercospora musae]|uniref:Uncharacterized protein n=1 Tax=Pseudocercospora musae TaxID=113226 RepID=A0A139I918_9PEZI|nr:hypothetical protein AC579_838 [Pseudocercospora musae]
MVREFALINDDNVSEDLDWKDMLRPKIVLIPSAGALVWHVCNPCDIPYSDKEMSRCKINKFSNKARACLSMSAYDKLHTVD